MSSQTKGDFGYALDALRAGYRVTRDSWPNQGYVCLQAGYPNGIAINSNTATATGSPEGTVLKFSPYLMHVSFKRCQPWLPSQLDVLATDWMAVR